jgi:Fur family transcriptional regulator, ferric uptake regulator
MTTRYNSPRSEMEDAFQGLPHAEARYYLAGVRVKATPARMAILDLLMSEKHPISGPSLMKKLKKSSEVSFDEATLYRSLEALVQSGLIHRVHISHDQSYYESALRKHHHHVVCISCGDIEDVDECAYEVHLKAAAFGLKKFKGIDRHSLEFFGTCNSCLVK